MGRKSEQARSFATEQSALRELEYGQREYELSEENRRLLEQGLGTDAQIAGQVGFTGPSSSVHFGGLTGATGHGVGYLDTSMVGPGGIEPYAQGIQAEANQMFAGGASSDEVQQFLSSSNPYIDTVAQGLWGQAFNIEDSPEGQAAGALNSPQGQIVGSIVAKSRDLLDINSEASAELRGLLTDNAQAALDSGRVNTLRGISTEQRGYERQARDIGARRASSSNPYAERAIAARTGERFSAQRAMAETDFAQRSADLHAGADRFYASYRDSFAGNAISLAQQWVNNQSGVRDQFTSTLNQFNQTQAAHLSKIADMHGQWAVESESRAQASKARSDAWIMYGVSAAMTIAGGVAGGFAAGAMGVSTSTGVMTGASVGSAAGGGQMPAFEEKY